MPKDTLIRLPNRQLDPVAGTIDLPPNFQPGETPVPILIQFHQWLSAKDREQVRILGAELREHIGSALVVKGGKLAGIFTMTDACRSFGEFLRSIFPDTGKDSAA